MVCLPFCFYLIFPSLPLCSSALFLKFHIGMKSYDLFLGLISLSITHSSSIHIVANGKLSFFFFFNVYLFLRERQPGRGRERGEEDSKWARHWQADSSEPNVGLKLTNCQIMTWAEVGCSTDSHPGAPRFHSSWSLSNISNHVILNAKSFHIFLLIFLGYTPRKWNC